MPEPVPPVEDEAANLDELLCFAVYSTGLAFNRAYKPLLERYGLTYSQYLVLTALHGHEGLTVSEIGERLFLESNTLTPLIKRMEAAGLVSRRREQSDERVVRVSLTDLGRSVIGSAAKCLPKEIAAATGLSAPELAALQRSIRRVREHLLENLGSSNDRS